MADPSGDSATPLTIRDREKEFPLRTEASHRFVLTKLRGQVMDVEDVHFHFDSAVLLPDFGDCGVNVDAADRNRVTGLAVVRSIYRHAGAHPEDRIAIAGHTDREGRDRYNLGLSQLRAENVLHLLQGKRDEWVKVCLEKHKVEDYQQILKWIDVTWGWGCDPGDVDDDLGEKTREAVKVFQEQYNLGAPELPEEFFGDIKVDRIVGEQTWGAFFDVYMQVLRFICEVDDAGLQKIQRSLRLPQRFVDPGRLAVGCGENFPLTANPVLDRRASKEEREEIRRRARTDRRVEVMFFEPGQEPKLLRCHPTPAKCVHEECEIFKEQFYALTPLPCEPLPPAVRSWVVRLLVPAPTKEEAGRRVPVAGRRCAVVDEVAGKTVFRGITNDKGVLRIPHEDGAVILTLKVDAADLLLGAERAGAKRQADGRSGAPREEPWEGEDGFLSMTLQCGQLLPISATAQSGPPLHQRLHNLGYGAADPEGWDESTTTSAIRAFQRDQGLDSKGGLTQETVARLKKEYGS